MLRFIKFNATHQKYAPENIFLIFKKGGNTFQESRNLNKNHIMSFSVWENPLVEVYCS